MEKALEVRGLTKTFPDNPGVYSALGDLMRSEERYDEAAPHYDHAVELTEAGGGKASWVLHYTRGISHERIGNWEQADASFRAALEIEPDQPLVLNYLGYSLVERRENLDEALKMIETAVEQRPEDGYIVDSLAWVYYRLDRFEDAVEPMERAVSLLPDDPIINDHLGDVYWMVGRKREARFQWTRALSFDPEEKELDRIRRKLEVGLDQVLAEEADAE